MARCKVISGGRALECVLFCNEVSNGLRRCFFQTEALILVFGSSESCLNALRDLTRRQELAQCHLSSVTYREKRIDRPTSSEICRNSSVRVLLNKIRETETILENSTTNRQMEH